MELLFYLGYHFAQITPIFILVTYFLINRHFKTTVTKVLFFSQLLVVILYISLFFIPGSLANHTQNGEIFKPSELYTVIFSAVHYLRFIPIIALLVFALKLNKLENNN